MLHQLPALTDSAIGTACCRAMPDEFALKAPEAYCEIPRVLKVLRVTVEGMAADIASGSKRGRALETMVVHFGWLATACSHAPTRDALRDTARLIRGGTCADGRGMVYRAACAFLGEQPRKKGRPN